MLASPLVFDRSLVRIHRAASACRFSRHRALFDEAGDRLCERLSDIKRSFNFPLEIGARDGYVTSKLEAMGMQDIISTDTVDDFKPFDGMKRIMVDEERLPFAPQSFDLILNNLNLHWVNDLPGALLQIKNALKPDGLFLASLLGGSTLFELRTALMEAEIEIMGGMSPRLSPTLELTVLSQLMQRAGFVLPVVDKETITFAYPDFWTLLRDLRGMGESNTHQHRLRCFSRKALFLRAADIYAERFRAEDGAYLASFEICFLHGWRSPQS